MAIDPLEAWNLPEEGGWICVDKRSEVNTLFVNVVTRDEVEVAMATGHSVSNDSSRIVFYIVTRILVDSYDPWQ